MKMLNEHYQQIKQGIKEMLEKRKLNIKDVLIDYRDSGLSERRMLFDLLYASKLDISNKEGMNLYCYLNDDNVATALKKIVKELLIENK